MEPKKKKSNCAVDAYATGDIGHSFALVESYRQKDDDSGPFPDKGVCVCSVFFSDRGPGLYEQTWGGLQRIVRGLEPTFYTDQTGSALAVSAPHGTEQTLQFVNVQWAPTTDKCSRRF